MHYHDTDKYDNLTQERVMELFHYNTDTGELWRKFKLYSRPSNCVGLNGYVYVGIEYKTYLAHKIAYLYMTGDVPDEIDHINGIRNDNRWCNLRIVDRYTNSFHRTKLNRNNTSGYRGVSWDKVVCRWRATVSRNYRKVWTDTYAHIEDAARAAAKVRCAL